MKLTHFTFSVLCLLVGITLAVQPIYAEPEEEATEEKTEEATGPEEGSKEWKRAKSIACQKQAAEEYKAMRLLTNMLKKAKNEKDYKKINKTAGDIVKKYANLYADGGSLVVNGMTITVEDLTPAHTKLGSQRKKLYKDFLEYRNNVSPKQQFGNWDNPEDDSKKKKKKKKKKEEPVDVDMALLDKVQSFMRANLGDFADKLDAEEEEKNSSTGR